MSSWVVLLVALVACLRLCGAQDPVPESLVNLVMNSPISSMKDLQELLDVHSVEEEKEDTEEEEHLNGTHKRLPRSLGDVQMAQPAVCKVRTEVMEITRSMLDRSNANFLLWPLCVEVQRCSGCCNARTLQCVPVTTEMRHLQMTKIQFVNRQPVYEKVILPVEDHLTCSCKSRTVSHNTWTKTTTSPPPPPRLVTKPPISSQSKEELHRHDVLKHNQRFQLEDQETQWQSKYTLSHTQRAPIHTPAHTLTQTHTQGYQPGPIQRTLTHSQGSSPEDASTRHTSFGTTHMLSDTTQHHTPVQEHHTHHLEEKVQEHHKHPGSGDDNIKSTASHEQPQHHQHHHDNHKAVTKTQHELSKSHTTEHHSQSDVALHHSSQLEAPVVSFSHVEVIGQSSGQSDPSSQSSTPSFHQSEVKSQSETDKLSESGQEKAEHHHHHHHHQHHPTEAATQRAVTNAPAGMPPAPHTPPPAVPQRRRRKKQRRRMSKSAMRAMIMVMS